MLSSASWASSSGALSGTPTNVTLSVAHNDESINAKASIVVANSAICTTTRAVITQLSPATEVVVTFSTSKVTAGAMVAKPPRAVRRISEMKCGPSTPARSARRGPRPPKGAPGCRPKPPSRIS